ncbi:hypothetical protein SLS58_003297 [Diplodia intermedia]|uniref:BAH domain-containing protein n=1 Tax=Diplodia intermedia TaxID=856260 RepID=A0ABR3TWQ1_9PEZI
MRLQAIIDNLSSIFSSVAERSADTITAKDELLEDFADVTLSEDEDDWPLPRPKRVKLDEASSKSAEFSQHEADPMVIDLTSDAENDDRDHRPDFSRTSSPQAEPGPPMNTRIHVKPSLSNYPRSLYEDWQPPLTPTSECIALDELLQAYVDPAGLGYIMIPIRQFRIYRRSEPEKTVLINRQHELEPLHHLKTDQGCDCLLVDGIITHNGLERYIEGVPFQTLAIEGYGDPELPTVSRNISIQSLYASAMDVWYVLREPAADYATYHGPFLWIADFAKHVVDYLSEHEVVSLEHFRSKFYDRTSQRHGESQKFQQWAQRFGGQEKNYDFRQAAVAYGSFLWKETWSVIDNPRKDPFWSDINYIADNEREDEPLRKAIGTGKTLVTPYVYKNFKHISQLRGYFECKKPSPRVRADLKKRKHMLGFTNAQRAPPQTSAGSFLKKDNLKRGDFVAIHPEESTLWKDGSDVWYAFIQDIRQDRHGKFFDVIWLYSASATTLAGGRYPFKNELFLSSHCNCHEAPLKLKDIAGKVNISWLKGSTVATDDLNGGASDFFVRQKFDTEHHCFTTIKASDFSYWNQS